MKNKTKVTPKFLSKKLSKEISVPKIINNDCIGWNFKYIEKDHYKYKMKFSYFLKYANEIISRFEEKTIAEIESSTPHTHYWKEIYQLDKEFQQILIKKKLEQEHIMQLALNGKVRIWGFVRGNIFHFLCMDFDYSIYKVSKKHT